MRLVVIACTAAVISSGAVAQALTDIVPPPRTAAVSPSGVNYQYGSYQFVRRWLTVGSGGFPTEMGEGIHYNSDADARLGKFKSEWSVRLFRTVVDKTTGPHPNQWICATHVVIGNRSDSFEKVGCGNAGIYDYGEFRGTILEFNSGTNKFTYRMKNGATITFPGGTSLASVNAENWVEPDGTEFTFGTGAVLSNRGFGLIFQTLSSTTTRACGVSLARDYLTFGSPCPADAPSITVVRNSLGIPISVTDATGGVWTFEYRPGTDYMSCYKEPGSAICQVTNNWQGLGNERTDRIQSQSFADGTGLTMGYQSPRNPLPTDPNPAPYINFETTETDAKGALSRFHFGGPMVPIWVRDPLVRQTDLSYAIDSSLSGFKLPEGNEMTSAYDDRINPTERRQKAKPGSGLADLVTTATYPASSGTLGVFPTCTYPKSCNKPASVTDARGNTTDYTYDPNHGGILTETRPAVNGIRPQTRYEYAQRYAWLKNSGGGYSQAASPVWLLIRERFCRTTAAVGQSCAGGAADEVVTDYDYGPNSGPNTLLLRGKAVTANGQTLRTCYGYDDWGRRISETRPNANLAVCP